MDSKAQKHNDNIERFKKLKEAAEVLRTELANQVFDYDKIAVVTKEGVIFYSNKLSIPKEADIAFIIPPNTGQK